MVTQTGRLGKSAGGAEREESAGFAVVAETEAAG